jgi:hypothetical protein
MHPPAHIIINDTKRIAICVFPCFRRKIEVKDAEIRPVLPYGKGAISAAEFRLIK